MTLRRMILSCHACPLNGDPWLLPCARKLSLKNGTCMGKSLFSFRVTRLMALHYERLSPGDRFFLNVEFDGALSVDMPSCAFPLEGELGETKDNEEYAAG